jgi:hypothetical protein
LLVFSRDVSLAESALGEKVSDLSSESAESVKGKASEVTPLDKLRFEFKNLLKLFVSNNVEEDELPKAEVA